MSNRLIIIIYHNVLYNFFTFLYVFVHYNSIHIIDKKISTDNHVDIYIVIYFSLFVL